MKDQVDALPLANGVAAFLNNSQPGASDAARQVQARLRGRELRPALRFPGAAAIPEFLARLRRIEIVFVAIDEAHCISEWGHDFRPEYCISRQSLRRSSPRCRIAAFTATATPRAQEDIVRCSSWVPRAMVPASFNRPNIFYKVLRKDEAGRADSAISWRPAGEPGIVYRATRKSVEQTADMLSGRASGRLPYHAGLDDDDGAACRTRRSTGTRLEVVVATIAFGMGIDKSNVRYVVHGDLPKQHRGLLPGDRPGRA